MNVLIGLELRRIGGQLPLPIREFTPVFDGLCGRGVGLGLLSIDFHRTPSPQPFPPWGEGAHHSCGRHQLAPSLPTTSSYNRGRKRPAKSSRSDSALGFTSSLCLRRAVIEE